MSGRCAMVVVAVLVVSAGCAQNNWHSQDVSVGLGYGPEVPTLPILNPRLDIRPRVSPVVRDIVQGEPVPVTFTFTNTGVDPVVLLRLESSQTTGTLHVWTHPVHGRLEYDEKTGVYSFHRDVSLRGAHEFHTGLVLPGEKCTLSVDLTFRDGGNVRQNFSLVYCRKVPELLREDIFIPEGETSGAVVRYVHPPTADVEAWRAERSRFENVIFTGSGGEMIFSFGRQFEVRRVRFSHEQALAKVGIEPDRFAYSPWKKGWLLEKDGGITLVTPHLVERYDGVTLPVFRFIESCRGTYLTVPRVSVRLHEGSVPFHVWDEEVYGRVADAFSGCGVTRTEQGHGLDVPVDDVFGLIRRLKGRGYRTVPASLDDRTVLGLETVEK